MRVINKILVAVGVVVFSLSSLGLAASVSLNKVFGEPDTIKTSLKESGAYELLAQEFAKQITVDARENFNANVDNEAIENAAKAAITPQIVEENFEEIIDGSYYWLDGSTTKPIFNIDTNQIEMQMRENLTTAASERVSGLPECSLAQLQQLDPGNIDPFTIPCRPPGLNEVRLNQQISESILSSENGMGGESQLTADDLTANSTQNIFNEDSQLPAIFQLSQMLPWVFLAALLISALVVFFLHETKQKGIKTLSITLLIKAFTIGVAILLVGLVVDFVTPTLGNGQSQLVLAGVIDSLVGKLNKPLIIFTATYALVGILGLAVIRLLRKNTHRNFTVKSG